MSDVTSRTAKREAQVKATPRPWWIRKHPHDDSIGIVVAKPTEDHPYFGHSTTIDIIGDEDYPRKRADQKLIVRAVNSHDNLLEALKAIMGKLRAISDDDDGCLYINGKSAGEFREPIALAEAAIQSAEEKPNAG